MHRFRQLLGFVSLVALAGGLAPAATPPSSGTSPDAAKHWTADNGNGTYSNPLFYEEFEDPDVIRVGEDYYLAGTTMHMNPAVQIMHSKDLVNWELAGYCMDRLDLGPAFRLEGGNIYGRGIWAPCIRYHKACSTSSPTSTASASRSSAPSRSRVPGSATNCPEGTTCRSSSMTTARSTSSPAAAAPIRSKNSPRTSSPSSPTSAKRSSAPSRMGEGHHLYKINGKYVDVSAIPGGPVDQMVAVADSIDGPWKVDTHGRRASRWA